MRRQTTRFDFMKKKRFQYGSIAAIFIVECLLYIEIPIFIELLQVPIPGVNITLPVCDISNLSFVDILQFFYIFESIIFPFMVMIICTFLIVRTLVKSRQALGAHTGGTTTNGADQQRRAKDFKFAVTSVAFNVLFVTFKVPLLCYYVLAFYRFQISPIFQFIGLNAFYLNYAIGIFVHLASNSLFRNEFLVLFRLRQPNRGITLVAPISNLRKTALSNIQIKKSSHAY
jgi:hypothetical protein